MIIAQQTNPSEFYRIVLFAPGDAKILILGENGRLCLPTVPVSKCGRFTENLTASLLSRWSAKAVCVPCVDPAPSPGPRYQVMESCQKNPGHACDSRWVSLSSLDEGQFAEAADYAVITKSWEKLRENAGSRGGHFARWGWFAELTQWVNEELRPNGLHLTDEFSQLNASATFSLIRFETNGPAVWFKAVGHPNLHEYRVTLALAKLFTPFLPCILAARGDWNGWLAVEAEGVCPDEKSSMDVWRNIASRLADLQIQSLGQSLHLLDVGCRDARTRALGELCGPFFDFVAELAEQQAEEPPARLSRTDLHGLRAKLEDVFSELENSEIFPTLGHLDFNPGNIVTSGDSCVFLDWAEVCVGHPFLTFQYLLEDLRNTRPRDKSSELELTTTYLNCWRPFASPSEVVRAIEIAPLLAVFAYAACGRAWRDPGNRFRPEVARQLRSLTRRMKSEADILSTNRFPRRLPCGL